MSDLLELEFKMVVICRWALGAGLCSSAHLPAEPSPRHIPLHHFLKIYYFYSLSFLRQGRHISGWPGVCHGVEEVLLPAPPLCWEHRHRCVLASCSVQGWGVSLRLGAC